MNPQEFSQDFVTKYGIPQHYAPVFETFLKEWNDNLKEDPFARAAAQLEIIARRNSGLKR